MVLSGIDAEIAELMHRRQRPTLGLRREALVLRAFVVEGRTAFPGEILRLPIASAVSAAKLGLVELIE